METNSTGDGDNSSGDKRKVHRGNFPWWHKATKVKSGRRTCTYTGKTHKSLVSTPHVKKSSKDIFIIKWEFVMVRCSKVFDIKHWGHLDHPFGSKHAIRTIQTNNHGKEKMETNYVATN
jgi:hypothetical protein